MIHGISYVCKMLQKIICCGVTHERRVPIPYLTLLMPQNLTVMSIWQAWKIWFKLSLNPTDRNFDLLISLTNLSFDQISIFNLSIDQISDIISTHLIAVWDITVWKHHSYYFIHVTVRVVWVTLYNTIQCSHYFSLQGVAV